MLISFNQNYDSLYWKIHLIEWPSYNSRSQQVLPVQTSLYQYDQ